MYLEGGEHRDPPTPPPTTPPPPPPMVDFPSLEFRTKVLEHACLPKEPAIDNPTINLIPDSFLSLLPIHLQTSSG
jgi:hypothetical protein